MSSSDTSACVGSFKIVVDRYGTNNETLLMLDFADLATFAEWANGRTAVGEVIPDLGDAAFLGPEGADAYSMVTFRSGNRAVRVAAGTSGKDISTDQLKRVAELISSRMQ